MADRTDYRNRTFPRRTSASNPQVGTVVTIPDTRTVEALALAGCDWLMLDCEHGAITATDLGSLLPAAGPTVHVAARIAENSERCVKQALDSGCDAIICPQVDTEATARDLVRWAKYPPAGERSVGISRAHKYGFAFADYVTHANSDTAVVVQIETVSAVSNLRNIIAVDGISGVFIGPYDLSGSLGMIGQIDSSEVRSRVIEVATTCHESQVPVGQYFGTAEGFLEAEHRELLDFVAIGIDITMMASTAANATNTIKRDRTGH